MTLKPIETRYAGYRFRSRLEARWAVFFDHLGIKWEYEAQGYVLDGRPYLPDFKLILAPGLVFAEIKNSEMDEQEGEHVELCRLLARDSRTPVLLLAGPPDIRYRMYNQFRPEPAPGQLRAAFFCDYPPKVVLADAYWMGRVEVEQTTGIRRFPFTDRDAAFAFGEQLLCAVYAARSARFEHGENGRST